MKRLQFALLLTTTAVAQSPLHQSGTTDGGIIFSTNAILGTTSIPVADHPPVLIAQCSRTPEGRTLFDLFVYLNGHEDLAYEGPWKRTYEFADPVKHSKLALSFHGYRDLNYGKRVFELIPAPEAHYHFLSPGMHSPNLEEFAALLPYMRALPTLRISDGAITADFLMTPLLETLHTDPVCAPLRL